MGTRRREAPGSRRDPDRTLRVHERGDGETLLFVLGWGNRPDDAAVDWLLDRLAADWTVHAVALPENGTDFRRDYVEPLVAVDDRVDPVVRAGFSLGGLVLAHLPGSDPRLYASPFWGLATDGLVDLVLPLVRRLPVTRRLVPVGRGRAAADASAEGDTRAEESARERGVSPAWLGAVHEGQRTLPPFREGSVVHCSLRDEVVDTAAIGERAPAERVRLYDGPHEFFGAEGRAETVERVRADLERLAAGA